jgi:four helix bundle protein
MAVTKFEDLIAWQKARELTYHVYKTFEDCRDFGFKDQIQRASISVMNNIAEGVERKGHKEFVRFLIISKASCGEVRSMLIIAMDLEKIDENSFKKLYELTIEISKMLYTLTKRIC